MKLYTPPEMSKKLVALGCTSESGVYYNPRNGQVYAYPTNCPLPLNIPEQFWIPLFEFEDFAGPESNENLFKIVKQGDSILDKKYRISHASNWVEEVGRGL